MLELHWLLCDVLSLSFASCPFVSGVLRPTIHSELLHILEEADADRYAPTSLTYDVESASSGKCVPVSFGCASFSFAGATESTKPHIMSLAGQLQQHKLMTGCGWFPSLLHVAHRECELFVITTPPSNLSPCVVIARMESVKLTVALEVGPSQMADQLGFPWFHVRSIVVETKPSTGTNQEHWPSLADCFEENEDKGYCHEWS